MKISFACTKCGKRLAAMAEHANRRFRCRECHAIQTVPSSAGAPDIEEETSDEGLTNEPAPAPRRRKAAATATTKEAPKRRRPVADFDEDEEDRPLGAPILSDEEDDEDDDFEERPKKRKGKKAKKKDEEASFPTMIVGLIVLIVILLGGIGAYFMFGDDEPDPKKGGQVAGPGAQAPANPGGNQRVNDVNFIPSNCSMLFSLQVASTWDSYWIKKIRTELPPEMVAQMQQGLNQVTAVTGLRIEDIERVTIVDYDSSVQKPPGAQLTGIVVLHKASFNQTQLEQGLKLQFPGVTQKTILGKPCLAFQEAPGREQLICFVGANVAVVTTEQFLPRFINAASNSGKFEQVKASLATTKSNLTAVVTGKYTQETMASPPNNPNDPNAPPGGPPLPTEGVDYVQAHLTVTRDIVLDVRIHCENEQVAKAQVAQFNQLKQGLQFMKGAAKQQLGKDPQTGQLIDEAFALVEKAQVQQQGAAATLNLTVPFDLINKAVNFAKANMPK